MVDILKAAGGSRTAGALITKEASTQVSADALARPFSALAQAVGYVGEKLDDISVPFNQAAGAASVVRNPDNTVSRGIPQLELSKGAAAYNAASKAGTLAEYRNIASEELQKLRLQYDGKPDEFRKAAAAFTNELGKSDPLIRPYVQQEASALQTQHFDGLMRDKHDRDVQRAERGIKANEDSMKQELSSLYEQGSAGSDRAKVLEAQMADARAQRAANPLFRYSPEEAERDRKQWEGEKVAAAVTGQSRRAVQAGVPLLQVLKDAEETVNADPNISPAEKYQVLGRIKGALAGTHAARTQMGQEAAARSQSMRAAMDAGTPFDDNDVSRMEGELTGLGRSQEARALRTTAAIKRWEASNPNATVEERLAYGEKVMNQAVTGQPKAGAAGGSGYRMPINNPVAQSFMSTVATKITNPNALAAIGVTGQHETQFQSSAVQGTWSDPSESGVAGTAGGILSWRGPRLDRLRSFAASQGDRGLGSPETQAKFFLQENPQLVEQLNAARTPEEALTLMNNAWAFRGYNRAGGERDKRFASLANWNGASIQPASASAGGDFDPDPVFKDMVKREREWVDKTLTTVMTGVDSAFKNGGAPTPREMGDLVALVKRTGDPELRRKAAEMLNVHQAAGAIDKLDGTLREQALVAIDQAMKSGKLDRVQRDFGRAAIQSAEAKKKQIEDQPMTAVANMGDLSPDWRKRAQAAANPINWGADVGAQIRERQTMSGLLQNREQVGARSLMTDGDAKALEAVIQSGDGKAIRNAFDGLSAMDDNHMAATLGRKSVKDVLNSAPQTGDPAKFNAVMSGLAALRSKNQNVFSDIAGEDTIKKVQEWETRLRYATPEQMAKTLNSPDYGHSKEMKGIFEGKADAAFAKMKPEDIVKASGGQWFFQSKATTQLTSATGTMPESMGNITPVMMSEYRTLLRDRTLANNGDVEKAKTQAAELLGKNWKVSSVNGNKFMLHAPEQVYGTVDGKHDWITKQVNDTILSVIPKATTPEMQSEKWQLVPDARTEQEARQAKEEPRDKNGDPKTKVSYRLVFVDPTTGALKELDQRISFDRNKGAEPSIAAAQTADAEKKRRDAIVRQRASSVVESMSPRALNRAGDQ